MSADFWAGYLSGAAGIVIGNPLDILKTRLQAGPQAAGPISTTPLIANDHALSNASPRSFDRVGALLKGSAAPMLGYGALNALLFMTYNRSMALMDESPANPVSLSKTWVAGAVAGLATFVVSAPTELIKCRAQVSRDRMSSWAIAREIWRDGGLRGLYWGGGVTSLRDGVGYGFYYMSYELSKRALVKERKTDEQDWITILLCGGIAGIVTWASVFPLDVIKTRVQTQGLGGSGSAGTSETTNLLPRAELRKSATQIARETYRAEGAGAFFRGLGVCSARAFVVNAVQWAVYEWTMQLLEPKEFEQSKAIY